jgi:hypothetical protein
VRPASSAHLAGVDDNIYYEDTWAMIWNINNSIVRFDQRSCAAAGHEGEPGKPCGDMSASNDGELGDI